MQCRTLVNLICCLIIYKYILYTVASHCGTEGGRVLPLPTFLSRAPPFSHNMTGFKIPGTFPGQKREKIIYPCHGEIDAYFIQNDRLYSPPPHKGLRPNPAEFDQIRLLVGYDRIRSESFMRGFVSKKIWKIEKKKKVKCDQNLIEIRLVGYGRNWSESFRGDYNFPCLF